MPLSAATLSGLIKANLEAQFTTLDSDWLTYFCDAVAAAVVTHITASATVTVTGVAGGVSSASGTIS